MAAKLSVTLIDVGSGDSIFLESEDSNGTVEYALIDSNDEPASRNAELFLIRHLRTKGIAFGPQDRLFKFVMMSHAHSDHMSGLKRILQTFGAQRFYYPEATQSVEFSSLLRYVTRSCAAGGRVMRHQVVNSSTKLPRLGDADLRVLWPPKTAKGTPYSTANENNNSIVLGVRLGNVRCLLSGDCEADAWTEFLPLIRKSSLRVLKVPHHGARNGYFDAAGKAVWRQALSKIARLGFSTHISPYGHPNGDVLSDLETSGFLPGKHVFRTDHGYHLTFETKGRDVRMKYSRI